MIINGIELIFTTNYVIVKMNDYAQFGGLEEFVIRKIHVKNPKKYALSIEINDSDRTYNLCSDKTISVDNKFIWVEKIGGQLIANNQAIYDAILAWLA